VCEGKEDPEFITGYQNRSAVVKQMAELFHIRTKEFSNSGPENAFVIEYFVAFISPSGKFPCTALNETTTSFLPVHY
jgi:hypothetical protein